MPDATGSTPFLSVVVPAYNVEAYLRQCLASVLDQEFDDLEVIVVLDAPTDRTSDIAHEVAALDHRVRVLRNERNQGLGPSRNNGLDVARGEYVMFLDSDDFLFAGSLEPVVQVARSHRAALVVYDYARVYWDDRIARNIRAGALANTPAPVTLADKPDLLRVLNVAWNKLYRRDFLLDTGLRFPVGYYEDIPFTYPILALAPSISLVDEVVIGYRQRRSGSILRSFDKRHAEVVDQIERTLETMDAHPEAAAWAGPIFQRCANHVLTVIDGGRLPEAHRATTFRRAGEVLARHVPAGYTPPRGAQGVKISCLLDGAYPRYTRYRRMNAARNRGRAVVRGVRRRLRLGRIRTAMRMAAYAVHRRRRLDPDLAVFYCLWGRPPVGNPAAIAAELARVRPSVRTVWLIRPGSVRSVPEGTDMVVLDSRAAQSVLARATYLVSDVNFPDHVRRRPGQVMLETQHGTPLKFMGLDMQRFEIPSSTMDYERLMKRVDVWTYNLSSNAYSTEVWRRAFPARYRMLEFGYPRNDRLVNATAEDTAAMRELLGIPEGHRVVLYAPTHRDYRKGFTTDLDVERLMAALPEDTTLLVRGHYFYAGRTAKAVAVAERIRNVSEHRQIEDLYLAADVMVTDYSSAMFDFANLGRPIVIHAPDIERYRATRGIYFDITAEPPGAVTRTDEELATVLADGSYASPENDALLAVFRQRFCQFDDGHAAERVVRAVFLGEDVEPPGSVHGTPPPLRTWVTDRAG